MDDKELLIKVLAEIWRIWPRGHSHDEIAQWLHDRMGLAPARAFAPCWCPVCGNRPYGCPHFGAVMHGGGAMGLLRYGEEFLELARQEPDGVEIPPEPPPVVELPKFTFNFGPQGRMTFL